MEPRAQAYTRRVLERRGVEVRLGEAVRRVTPHEVHLGSGEVLPVCTLVWAAGVRANPLADLLGFEQTRGRRLVLPSFPETDGVVPARG